MNVYSMETTLRQFLCILLVCRFMLVKSRRSQSKDRETNRKYSRWDDWSLCPATCHLHCHAYCVQIRYKICLKPELCQRNVLKDERICGRCKSRQQQQPTALGGGDSFGNAVTTDSADSMSNGNLPAIRAQDTGELVQLAMHCLPNKHFSSWGNWSECFDVCRKVRFRHCTSPLCIERVPSIEDAAVKQEEWCIPKRKMSANSAPACEEHFDYVSTISRRESSPLQLGQCEALRRRRRVNTQMIEQIERTVKKAVTKGSVLDLGVPCGVQNTPERRLRIIGGTTAGKGRWPWQVAIMIDKQKTEFNDFPHIFSERPYLNYTENPSYVQYCGGTLINNEWVLTAAHCVKQKETGMRKPNMVVMVGETDMRVMKEKGNIAWQKNIYKISRVIGHSRFEWESVNNDIALLKLEKSVVVDPGEAAAPRPSIGFSCVPDEDLEASPGNECVAVGWGKHNKYMTKQRASKRLQEVSLPLVSRQQCKLAFNFTITKNQMCAGYEDGRSDSCDGDSGGPLLCKAKTGNGERWVIYGITSFGSDDGCGIAGKYGVYTKVTNYSKWIKYAMETGEQLQESKTESEGRRRRHNRKQNRKRERDKERPSPAQKSNSEMTTMRLSMAANKQLTLVDSPYDRKRP